MPKKEKRAKVNNEQVGEMQPKGHYPQWQGKWQEVDVRALCVASLETCSTNSLWIYMCKIKQQITEKKDTAFGRYFHWDSVC